MRNKLLLVLLVVVCHVPSSEHSSVSSALGNGRRGLEGRWAQPRPPADSDRHSRTAPRNDVAVQIHRENPLDAAAVIDGLYNAHQEQLHSSQKPPTPSPLRPASGSQPCAPATVTPDASRLHASKHASADAEPHSSCRAVEHGPASGLLAPSSPGHHGALCSTSPQPGHLVTAADTGRQLQQQQSTGMLPEPSAAAAAAPPPPPPPPPPAAAEAAVPPNEPAAAAVAAQAPTPAPSAPAAAAAGVAVHKGGHSGTVPASAPPPRSSSSSSSSRSSGNSTTSSTPSNQVAITSHLLLSFLLMDYQALVQRPPSVVDSFQLDLMVSLCGILDTWVQDPGAIWRPPNSSSSSSNSMSAAAQLADEVGVQPGGLWQQLPAAYVQYRCTVNALMPGSVLVNLTIDSTAGLTGTTTSNSSSTSVSSGGTGIDPAQTLALLLEARVSLLGSMLGAGAALSPEFHTSYTTHQDVVVVRMEHVSGDNPDDDNSSGSGGGEDGGWLRRVHWRLVVGAAVAGAVGVVLGVGVILYLRQGRHAGLNAVIQQAAKTKQKKKSRSSMFSVLEDAAAAAEGEAQEAEAEGGQGAGHATRSSSSQPSVSPDLENSMGYVQTAAGGNNHSRGQSFKSRQSFKSMAAAAAATGAGGASGSVSKSGRPSRASLTLHVTGHSESHSQEQHTSPMASPGDVMLVPVTTPRHAAGRSWRLVRNLQAAAQAISNTQNPSGVRHTPVAPGGVTRPPRAAWSIPEAVDGEAGSSNHHLASACIPDAALLAALQRNSHHGRHLLTDVCSPR